VVDGGEGLLALGGRQRVACVHRALVIGPLVVGMLDRRFGRTGPVCAVGHLMAAAIMVLMVAGGPGGLLPELSGCLRSRDGGTF